MKKPENKSPISENSFSNFFREKLCDFLESDKKTLIVPISGFSGVGKSTFIQKIKSNCELEGVPFVLIKNDMFIGTESGSDERQALTQSWKNFRTFFYNEKKIQELVKKIITSKDRNICIKETYRRFDENKKHHGKFDGKEEFSIPNGKFVLILDGVNSVGYVNNYTQKIKQPECALCNFTILDKPSQSLLRAVFRDANNKECDFKNILKQRLGEYFYMQFWIKENIQNSTNINIQNISDITKKLMSKYAEKNKISTKKLWEDIVKVANIFEKEKINKYPLQYSSFGKNLIQEITKTSNEAI